MTYEELEILIKNRRTSERRAELVRAIPSEKEEAKGNDDITQPHSSNPHNKLIANVLYSTSYIERWGSGVKRITDACAYRNVETPTWKTDGYFVTVTFKRPDYNANVPIDVTKDVPKDNSQIKSDWSFVALAERLPKDCRKEVLDTLRLIVNDPSIKHKEIAERLAVSERTAGTYVSELKRYCIKRVGGNTFGHWEAK